LRPTSQTSGCMPDENMTDSLGCFHTSTKEIILDDTAQLSMWCRTPCEASRYCTTRSHNHRFRAKQASVVIRCNSSLARKLPASSRTSVFKVWHRTSNSQSTIVTELYRLKPPTFSVRHLQTSWLIHCCAGLTLPLVHFFPCTLAT
jgi:hypothetical protein